MILGIHCGHDATSCLVSENGISAIAEERITRIKNFEGIPLESIKLNLECLGVALKDVSEIAVASTLMRNSTRYWVRSYFKRRPEDFSNYASPKARIDALRSLFPSQSFHQRLQDLLSAEGFKGKLSYKDHHFCHIASSLAVYPFDDCCLVSMDGGGDGINWAIYSQQHERIAKLASMRPDNDGYVHESPADVYANTTKFLGFKRLRHEGKLTGLGAYGQPKHIEYFDKLLRFEDGAFVSRIPYTRMGLRDRVGAAYGFFARGVSYNPLMVNDMKEHLAGAAREDVAASLQCWLGRIMSEFFSYYCSKFDLAGRPLLLSGGLFANVLLNQQLHECGLFENVYVVPNMGDGGLTLGAAYLAMDEQQRKKLFSKPLETMYLGPHYSKSEILNEIRGAGLEYKELTNAAEFAARALQENQIVGLFTERMEFGPRALGARSILANPSRAEINAELNGRLHRSEFMPFAPYILQEDARMLLKDYRQQDHSARFMTMTYSVTDLMKTRAPAVVHLDGTARPQVIERHVNPLYYDILKVFKERTGIPVLINTSFNAHEEPIVMSPRDAINAFTSRSIDLLLFDNIGVMTPDLYRKLGESEISVTASSHS